MAVIYDARGNAYLGSIDGLTGDVVTDARAATAVLGALNAETAIDLNGKATIMVAVRSAAFVGTIIIEGSVDGVNYDITPMVLFNVMTEQYTAFLTGAGAVAGTVWAIETAGIRRIRVRVSAYTSGSITVAVRASVADSIIYAKQIPSTLMVTATAAANTQAVATLAAPGAGLYHYITNINLMRNATAALAGTATLIHTSTNLPGNPAWSVGNAMAAGGTQTDLDFTPVTPLKSSVANTATTITMPAAGAAVLNRINVSYYIGA